MSCSPTHYIHCPVVLAAVTMAFVMLVNLWHLGHSLPCTHAVKWICCSCVLTTQCKRCMQPNMCSWCSVVGVAVSINYALHHLWEQREGQVCDAMHGCGLDLHNSNCVRCSVSVVSLPLCMRACVRVLQYLVPEAFQDAFSHACNSFNVTNLGIFEHEPQR